MKKSLIFIVALMLVVAFAATAMAAQPLNASKTGYLSTSAGAYYTTLNDTYEADLKFNRNPRFNPDGITNYPYEIYLPNEQEPDKYRIHSNYAKNTDACASCHATHTAVGASLLQWYSVYETCMACHDGTLGSATYNVLDGEIGVTGKPAYGGLFGDGEQISLSNHNVTGLANISAAPGGTTVDTEQVNGAHGSKNTRWVNEFGCESCHSPHGQGGNARILHPDTNYAASWAAEQRETPNKYFVNPANGKVYSDAAFTTEVYIIKGYPYSPSVVQGDLAVRTLKIDNTSGTSIIRDAAGLPTTDASVYVLGVASLKVTMNITGYLTTSESVTHVYGLNFYCGTCHTDYNTASFATSGSAEEHTGVYSQAHRHQMGMDWYSNTPGLKLETSKKEAYAAGSMSCLTCHVAHGVSQDFWAKTLIQTGQAWATAGYAEADLYEMAGSSALKRMPNMGTCEACHAKGEGSEGYNANAGITLDAAYPVDGISDSLSILKSASYVGMNSAAFGVDSCITCHEEAVKEWAETQHNMFAPYDNNITLTEGNRYLKADGKGLNSTEESIKLLEELYVASENYQPAGQPKGIVAQIKAYIDAQGAKYDNAYNDAISAKDIFTVGQLPIGSRYKMEALREYIVRLYDNTDAQYEYVVIGAAVWEPALNEWEIEGAAYLEGEDNYTGSCFNCHFSLTTDVTASASGTANEAGKDANRVWLDKYYNYLYAGAAKPARDFGISCEACHGAASKHVAAPTAQNIFTPSKYDTTVQSRVCGRCHVSSGNKNSFFAFYQPWKLVSNEAITPGVVTNLTTYTGGVSSFAYATYAEQMNAFFKAGWEATDVWNAGTNKWELPVADTTSVTDWTYKSKEGRNWGTGGHTQYTTYALNRHFTDGVLSCSSCHDSHSGAKGEFQLKLDPVRLCEACHSAGGSRMAVKYMPMQTTNNVRMHDFGKVIDSATGLFKNTNLTVQPRYDAGAR